MEVLLRRFKNEPYVWQQAKFENGCIKVDNMVVTENKIVSIQNDIRKNYVKCIGCGTYFKKGSPKIEKHKNPVTDTHLCFNCEHLCQRIKTQKSQKYELLENGNYLSKSKNEVSLTCRMSYEDINSTRSREKCKHNRCQYAAMVAATGFFISYPNAFDDMITIDKIMEHGYKNAEDYSYDGFTYYRLKGRYNIQAMVNTLNIVEGFSISYRNHYFVVYYSKKYNKFFVESFNSYKEWSSSYYMDDEVVKRIKEIIVNLYK